jgi:hypothetical protein
MALDTTQLRHLAGHPSYWIPGNAGPTGEPQIGLLRDPGGARVLVAFRTRAQATAAQVAGDVGGILVASGSHVFRLRGFDRIDIDPGSDDAQSYSGEELGALGVWAEIVAVERAVEAPETCEDPFLALCSFSRYLVVARDGGQAPDLMMAPDDAGRQLLAIFTAEDAVDAFVRETGTDGVATTLSGEDLFFALRDLPIDGFVVNCCGPTATRAFAKGVIDRILTAGR